LGFIYNSEKPGTRFNHSLIIDIEDAFRHLDQKYKTPTDLEIKTYSKSLLF